MERIERSLFPLGGSDRQGPKRRDKEESEKKKEGQRTP